MGDENETSPPLESYKRELRAAAEEIAAMNEATAAGDELVPGLPEKVQGRSSFRFLDDLPSRTPENDAWDIEFEWLEGATHANFTLWFASSQSMGGDGPQNGWVSWTEPDLLVAFIQSDFPFHEALLVRDFQPLGHSEEEDTVPENWVKLARGLLRAMFGEADVKSLAGHVSGSP